MSLVDNMKAKLAEAKRRLAEQTERFHDETAPLREVIDRLHDYIWKNDDHKADEMIREFVAMRDERSALKAEYEDADKKIKDRMEAYEAKFLEMMAASGTDKLSGPDGTAYTQVEVWSSCSDWPTYWKWMADTGRFDGVEKRVGQKMIRDMVEAGNELPPGINTTRERKVIIRRK